MLRKTHRYTPKGDTTVVVSPAGDNSLAGKLLDESSNGIGVLLDDVAGLCIGREVRVEFRGQRIVAVVRGIRKDGAEYRVALWLRNPLQ